jgi:glycosyltransferase involved in cell wall biosynthesis
MINISIIITSYNHERFVAKAIQSLLNQIFQDFELIIIDDASSDNSASIIESFSSEKIKTIFLKKNVGFCRAANIALQEAKGEYIKFFASDDIAEKNCLGKQLEFLQKNPKYDAVFSRMTVIDEKDRILTRKTKRFDKYFLCKEFTNFELLNHFFYRGNCLAAPTALIRKSALDKVGGFDERIIQTHDFDLWVRLALKKCEFYILPERLVQYRRISNDGNMSANTDLVRKKLVFDNEKILERYLMIKDVKFFVEIFPNLKSQKILQELIPFFLAKEALLLKSLHHRQFAVSALYNLLKEKNNVNILESEFNFSINQDFAKIVEDNPLGVLNEIINRKSLIQRLIKASGNKIKKVIF